MTGSVAEAVALVVAVAVAAASHQEMCDESG